VSVRMCDAAQELYLFYATLFWRFLDSYWMVCLGFFILLPNRVLCESLLINHIQSIGENLYFQGQLDLFEAIAKETLLNAVSLFINWKVIEHLNIEGSTNASDMSHVPGRRVIRLTQEYQTEEALEQLVTQIGSYRKSLRAYKSRGFMTDHFDETKDAIELVKKEIRTLRTPNGKSSGLSLLELRERRRTRSVSGEMGKSIRRSVSDNTRKGSSDGDDRYRCDGNNHSEDSEEKFQLNNKIAQSPDTRSTEENSNGSATEECSDAEPRTSAIRTMMSAPVLCF